MFSTLCIVGVDAQERDNRAEKVRQARVAEMIKNLPIVSALDANGDGEISAAEIELSVSALKALDKNKDGKLAESEIFAERRPQGQGQRTQSGRADDAPKVGQVAPTFKLKSLDGESETDLADFKGKKPVVLFFGSYT